MTDLPPLPDLTATPIAPRIAGPREIRVALEALRLPETREAVDELIQDCVAECEKPRSLRLRHVVLDLDDARYLIKFAALLLDATHPNGDVKL